MQRLIPHAQLRLISADWRQLGQQDVLHAPTAGGIAHNASQSDMQQGLHLQQDCKLYSSPACPELPAVSGHGQSAPFHVYLYDGGHTYLEQYRALTHFWDILADPCVLIVDDWNWPAVRKGTLDALQALQPRILLQHEIRLTQDDSHTPLGEAVESFWNGLGVFVLGK